LVAFPGIPCDGPAATPLLSELSRKTHVFGAIHTPKPQLLFLTLEEIQSLSSFFMARSKEEARK